MTFIIKLTDHQVCIGPHSQQVAIYPRRCITYDSPKVGDQVVVIGDGESAAIRRYIAKGPKQGQRLAISALVIGVIALFFLLRQAYLLSGVLGFLAFILALIAFVRYHSGKRLGLAVVGLILGLISTTYLIRTYRQLVPIIKKADSTMKITPKTKQPTPGSSSKQPEAEIAKPNLPTTASADFSDDALGQIASYRVYLETYQEMLNHFFADYESTFKDTKVWQASDYQGLRAIMEADHKKDTRYYQDLGDQALSESDRSKLIKKLQDIRDTYQGIKDQLNQQLAQ